MPRASRCLGGMCLNVGCIPSKALLDSSHHFHHDRPRGQGSRDRGEGLSLDLATMLRARTRWSGRLTQGIAGLFKKNDITWLAGTWAACWAAAHLGDRAARGRWRATHRLASHIIIATGSVPAPLPGMHIDNGRICDSTAALAFSEVPRSPGIIGAGVDRARAWKRVAASGLGGRYSRGIGDLLPSADFEITRAAAKELKRARFADPARLRP